MSASGAHDEDEYDDDGDDNTMKNSTTTCTNDFSDGNYGYNLITLVFLWHRNLDFRIMVSITFCYD